MLITSDKYKSYSNLILEEKKNIIVINDYISNNIITKNISKQFHKVFLYIRKMTFTQKPNYDYIINTLLT